MPSWRAFAFAFPFTFARFAFPFGKKTLGDRAFTAVAPSLWNKLPSARDEDNLKRFESRLKTFI